MPPLAPCRRQMKISTAVFKAGGKPVGELITRTIASVGHLTLWYVADPEGNIIELQKLTPQNAQMA